MRSSKEVPSSKKVTELMRSSELRGCPELTGGSRSLVASGTIAATCNALALVSFSMLTLPFPLLPDLSHFGKIIMLERLTLPLLPDIALGHNSLCFSSQMPRECGL
jgi:hypothetical protein